MILYKQVYGGPFSHYTCYIQKNGPNQTIKLNSCPVIISVGCSEAHERKATKYQDLVQQCRDKGWQAWLFPVEVGCRGFPAQSVWNTLTALGIRGRQLPVGWGKPQREPLAGSGIGGRS